MRPDIIEGRDGAMVSSSFYYPIGFDMVALLLVVVVAASASFSDEIVPGREALDSINLVGTSAPAPLHTHTQRRVIYNLQSA